MQIQNVSIYNVVTLTALHEKDNHILQNQKIAKKFYFHPSRKIRNGNESVSKNINSR